MKIKYTLLITITLLLACIFSGCTTADNAPNAFTVDFEETYGPVSQTSRVKIPHDLAANGLSIRTLAFQDDVGDRAVFESPSVAGRGGTRVAQKGISNEAELIVFEHEHLGMEVTLFQPTLVNQEAIALANVELQKAISSDNTEQIRAWGDIIGSLTEGAISAFAPIP